MEPTFTLTVEEAEEVVVWGVCYGLANYDLMKRLETFVAAYKED